jgi:hypothetical protein
MFGRRLIILVAVLMGLTALAASVAPAPQTERRGAASPTPSPTPTTPGSDRAAAGRVVSARIEVGSPGEPLPRVRARVGDTVMLDVSGDVIDSVVVDDLPAIEPIAAATPAQLQLFAAAPGRYPVRLLDARRDIGVLEVDAGRR